MTIESDKMEREFSCHESSLLLCRKEPRALVFVVVVVCLFKLFHCHKIVVYLL